MGHALMDRVVRDWGDLRGNAYKCLMVMASCAMDDAAPPVYFGGWERLAVQALGKRKWPADADESIEAVRTRKSYAELVRLAIAELRRAGAIETKKRGRPGSRAEFNLLLPQRILGLEPKQSLASTQRNSGDQQGNFGANYQHSPHSQSAEITSPKPLPHQRAAAAVDNHRLTPEQRADAQRRADEEAVA